MLGEKGKSNWQKFKDKAKDLNNSATKALKPLKDKMSEIKKDLGDKFQNSDNKAVKGIRGNL